MDDARSSTTDSGNLPPLDPVDAYKTHIDPTLIREQLRRTVNERVERLIGALRLVEELRAAGRRGR